VSDLGVCGKERNVEEILMMPDDVLVSVIAVGKVEEPFGSFNGNENRLRFGFGVKVTYYVTPLAEGYQASCFSKSVSADVIVPCYPRFFRCPESKSQGYHISATTQFGDMREHPGYDDPSQPIQVPFNIALFKEPQIVLQPWPVPDYLSPSEVSNHPVAFCNR
jgi:hypothetical protein